LGGRPAVDPPRPPRGDTLRWIIGLVELAVVVAVGAVLLFTGQGSRTAATAVEQARRDGR
jgi:hypothetical protein